MTRASSDGRTMIGRRSNGFFLLGVFLFFFFKLHFVLIGRRQSAARCGLPVWNVVEETLGIITVTRLCHTDSTVSPGRGRPAPGVIQHADVLLDQWVKVIILFLNVVLVVVVVTAVRVDQR